MNTPHRTTANPYPVLCAWCWERGLITVTGWCVMEHSHGMCEECGEEVLREAKEVTHGKGRDASS